MNYIDAYRFLRDHPQNKGYMQPGPLAFVANVVLTNPFHSSKRAMRLRRLVKLVKEGRIVRFPPYQYNVLSVDGEVWEWTRLDEC